MPVPSSGEISLSRILREIQFCDFVGTSGYGGYLSNGTMTATNISLSGLDTNSSIRTADTNRGDSTAPYAISEWYSYSDLEPDKINIYATLSVSVPENPIYTIRIVQATRTRTFFIGRSYGTSISAQTNLDGNTSITIRIDRTTPDATTEDVADFVWRSIIGQCVDSNTWTQDQAISVTANTTITNYSYSYTNVSVGDSFQIQIDE